MKRRKLFHGIIESDSRRIFRENPDVSAKYSDQLRLTKQLSENFGCAGPNAKTA